MKTRALLALLLLFTLGATSYQTQPAPEKLASLDDYGKLEQTIQAIAERVRPAVVGVRMSRSSGSGCFISEDGWVATCGHVTGTTVGTKCRIVMHGGETLDAVTAGWHEAMDYALVKADTKGKKVPFCELGMSEDVKPGDWLIPMGHPLGPEGGRDAVVRAGRCLVPENARSMIVTDAPVISGDSGGPVFDLNGKIVAINQSIQTNNVHINNVTPVKLLKELLKDLKENKTFGNASGPSWGRGVREPAEGALQGKEIRTYQQAIKALQDRKLKRCCELFDELLKPEKRTNDVLYNAGCAYSLRSAELEGDEAEKMAKKAIAALQRSVEAGWRDMDHASRDPDLDSLRDRDDFKQWMENGRKMTKRPAVGLVIRSNRGIRVDEVHPGSPAYAAGFEVNDIIERIDREKMSKAKDWIEQITERGISPDQEVKVSRRGKREVLHINIAPFGARVFGQGGARIMELQEGGLAYSSGLRVDDVIVKIGDTEVEGGLDFVNAMLMIDANQETVLEVKRGYLREKIKFSYSTGDLGEGGGDGNGTLPGPEWKQGDKLLELWTDMVADRAAGTVFPVKRKGKQVAFATAVSADGLLLTKASELAKDDTLELLDGTSSFEAKLVARNDRYDVALLKAGRKFKKFIDFSSDTIGDEFPRIGTLVATVDAKGRAAAHGFIALPPYDTDKMAGAPDPNSPFVGINARDAKVGGAEVTAVTPGMPADKAGIKVGDIVVKMAGQAVENWSGLIAMIRGRDATDKVVFTVKRGDETLDLDVQLVPRAEALGEKAPAKGTGKPELGIFASRPLERGVEIGAIKPGSPAELAGLNSGETLLKIDNTEITQQRDIDNLIKGKKIGDQVSLLLLRDGEETTLEVELAEEDAPPPPPGGGRPNVKGPINDRHTHLGKVIQHDGVVLPSQQGSPVFDLRGKLVGLNIARADRTRTFTLSAKKVAEILEELQHKSD